MTLTTSPIPQACESTNRTVRPTSDTSMLFLNFRLTGENKGCALWTGWEPDWHGVYLAIVEHEIASGIDLKDSVTRKHGVNVGAFAGYRTAQTLRFESNHFITYRLRVQRPSIPQEHRVWTNRLASSGRLLIDGSSMARMD